MSANDLRAALDAAASLPPQARRKAARTIGHLAMTVERSGTDDPDEIDLAIRALGLGAAVHSYPQKWLMARAWLMQRRRELLGLEEPVVVAERAATLDIEAGAVVLADASRDPAGLFAAPSPWHGAMNSDGFVGIALGSDGDVKVRVRVVSSPAPEPLAAEFRRLRDATPEAWLSVTTGAVAATGGGSKRLLLETANGDYRVAGFGLGSGRAAQLLVILAPGRPAGSLETTPELRL
ncbi:hypothetical protein HKCCE2091_01600 [Rhodobacterales bacterium HKCCE2091]|nr:hypothetical protein [Rhodobacterales bacterium HKCCE2091]